MSGTPALKALLFATAWALLSVGGARAAESITLKNLRADVEVIPGDRPDVAVSVEPRGSADPPPVVSRAGDRVTVQGQIQTGQRTYRISLNLDRGMDVEAMKRRSHVQRTHPSDLPLIVIHTPLKVRLKSGAYVFGHIGPSRSLAISDNGDGEWRIDAVSEDVSVEGNGGTDFHLSTSRTASVDMLGTGNVALGDTQSLYASLWGSGNVTASRIGHDLDLTLSGIGDFEAQSVSGPMHVLISDAGGARIEDGDVSKLTVRTIDGIGGVQFGGTVKDVDVDIGTITRVHIHKVTGVVRKITRQQATLQIDNP